MGQSNLDFLNSADSVLYFPVLIIVMTAAGLYFSFRTKFVQLRLFKASDIGLKPEETDMWK